MLENCVSGGALGVTIWSPANCRLPPSRLVLFRVSFCLSACPNKQGGSAVELASTLFTAKMQRTQRKRRFFSLGLD
jgi:hypothetical protein